MRSNQEDTSAFNTHFKSGRFSHSRKVLDDDVEITANGSLVNFLDANGANRIATLPALEEGRFYVVSNVGAANNILVKDAAGALITTLLPDDSALMFASEEEWVALRGWAALGVFTNTINGLVPAPNSAVPGSLFLRDDGQWGQVQVTGIVDAFKFITDGTNTAIGSGPDTFWMRSSTNKIGITVTNGEAVYGDNVNLTVLEAQVDHDALLNFVVDEHAAHSSVVLTAGLGLTGGGDITASRTFTFTPSELPVNAAPVLTDYAVMDLNTGSPQTALWSSINAIFNHNALLNYEADRHVLHAGVSVVAGTGLSGGGNISTSLTLNLDINELTSDTPAITDTFAFYDVSGADHNKATFAVLNGILDHNSLLNYVADQHVAHSGVTITAGAGLTGGGAIDASRTLTVGAGTGITVNADDVALDTTNTRNVDHASVSISTTEGVQGGGTIAATRTLKLDINGLTVDAAPDTATDYLATYDASAGVHKKILISSLPSGGGAVLYSSAQSLTNAQKSQARANIDVLKKNYIVNGAMQVSQENGTTAGTTSGYYPVDQFSVIYSNGGAVSIAQVASATPGGSTHRMRVTVTTADAAVAAGDYTFINTKIEGIRCADLLFGTASAKAFVLQFGVKAPAGTYGVAFRNSAANRIYVGEFTIAGGEANTDVVKSITLTADTSGTWLTSTGVIGLDIYIALMAGSSLQGTANAWGTTSIHATSSQFNFMGTLSNVFELFDVSLTEGSVAPTFQVPDYVEELQLCRRYWESTFVIGTQPVAGGGAPGFLAMGGYSNAANVNMVTWQFKAQKCKIPTGTTYNPWLAANTGFSNSGSGNLGQVTYSLGDAQYVIRETSGGAGGGNLSIHAKADARL